VYRIPGIDMGVAARCDAVSGMIVTFSLLAVRSNE
jgi:hypothetical protein